MRYAAGTDERGRPVDVRDPLAAELKRAAAGLEAAEPIVEAFLQVRPVFGADLPRQERFRTAVIRQLGRLLADGAQRTVEDVSLPRP